MWLIVWDGDRRDHICIDIDRDTSCYKYIHNKAHGSQLARRGIIKQSTPSKGAQVFDTFILLALLKTHFFLMNYFFFLHMVDGNKKRIEMKERMFAAGCEAARRQRDRNGPLVKLESCNARASEL